MSAPSAPSATPPHPELKVRDAFSLQRGFRALTTPSTVQIGALDGLRAFSVIWIIAYHTAYAAQLYIDPARYQAIESAGILMPVTLAAHYALDVFFVMSGFLIAQLLLSEKRRYGDIALPRFYARRALRLLPAYYPAMLFLFLAEPSQVKPAILDFNHILGIDWQIDLHMPNWGANLLYFNNFLPWDRQFMGWSWTLAIEEQFYITFPLFLMFVFKRGWPLLRTFVIMFALAFVVRAIVAVVVLPHSDVQNAMFVKSHTRYGSIQLGVICAYYYLFVKDVAARKRFIRWLFLGPVLFVVGVVLWKKTGMFLGAREVTIRSAHHYLIGSLICWVVMNVIEPVKPMFWRFVDRLMSTRILFILAQVSYSTYLLHLTVIALVYRYVDAHHPFGLQVPDTPAGVLAWILPFIAICALAATPMYLFIEHPCMVLRNIWFRRRQAPLAQPAPIAT
ncbi:MAG: acyltransferase [Deltaproteobacteria bacterium]|nr:acyltransferase [Deltaproteobacteria bacterium]